MQEFKVGDWVMVGGVLKRITALSYDVYGVVNAIFCDQAHYNIQRGIEPWQPKEGEWCWFLFDNGKKKKQYEFGQFDEEVFDTDGKYYTSKQNKKKWFAYCEPFLGSLPSFLKDK